MFLTPEQQQTIVNVLASALALILSVVIPILATIIAQAASQWWVNQKDEKLRSVIQTSVYMIEQVYKTVDGDSKKKYVMALVQDRLSKIGFGAIDLTELDILVEAAVKKMNIDLPKPVTPVNFTLPSGVSIGSGPTIQIPTWPLGTSQPYPPPPPVVTTASQS